MKFLRGLNPQQRAAVEHGAGPLLLLAGAGSGKTRVITCRIAYLLKLTEVPAESLLAVTFTNKAAREMRERVLELAGRKAATGVTVSTFHSFCVQVLKEHIHRLGYRKRFSIYAAADQLRLIKDLLERLDTGGRRLDADRIQWIISDAKNRLISPEQFTVPYADEYQLAAAELYPRYQKALKGFNAVDFDDLIMLTDRLFRECPDVLRQYQQRFQYLLVDEYQDTNAAQYGLLRQLAAGHGNLCVVGDDDQSIYGWRGADLGNILEFERDFPGTTVIRLEQNYRSSGNILNAANAVIQKNQKRKEKQLWTSDGPGASIELLACVDEEDEAERIIERIRLEQFKGRSWRDFAILYRTNVQSRVFEQQLRYNDIPFVLVGGQQFFDRKEVKDAIAYLKVLVNPFDEINLLRILNYPRRGIGATSAERLIQSASERGCTLWEVLRDPAVAGVNDQARAALALFVRLLDTYRYRFRESGDLTSCCRELFVDLDLEGEIERTTNDLIKAARRKEFVREVISALEGYQQREGRPTLDGFLDKVSLLDDEREDAEKKQDEHAVTLMSLHSSKGLEFPVVFLVGVEEDFLPHRKSIDETFDIEEERRLCYVGITRAREQLVLSHAGERLKYGKALKREPSRFLEEIPPELLDQLESESSNPASEEQKDAIAGDFFSKMGSLLDD